ncbi:YoaK family protein [Persicobacter sp. CCB-QB2]|uniref:YoaK family protein n=1 Tax=Persicobacter sp. CCB-QB2 TaxID=1561025 RepID=UPI0006A9D698|nr:YoaK family protein [Persicobacter sp. CCB-QB2]
MFKLKELNRTFSQNLQLACFLTFAAGLVNIIGLLEFGRLVTHVTGHYTYFAEAIGRKELSPIIEQFGFIFFFLTGASTASLLIYITGRKYPRYSHTTSIFLEVLLLFMVIFLHNQLGNITSSYILLFAMGLQNAMVTRVSGAVVRTTHLTGITTDIGMELVSFFWKKGEERKKIGRQLTLQISIAACFICGGAIAVFDYGSFGVEGLFIPVVILLGTMAFDAVRRDPHSEPTIHA